MFLELRKTIANFVCPEIESERRAMERAANVDALTGLANRRAFNLAEPSALADNMQWFVLFDANNFGKVNKLFGHEQGDEILIQIGKAIKDAADVFGLGERVFRLGGDEFVAIIDGQTKARTFRDMAESNFGTMFFENSDLQVSISGTLGFSVESADQKLQARKAAAKRPGVSIYDLPN